MTKGLRIEPQKPIQIIHIHEAPEDDGFDEIILSLLMELMIRRRMPQNRENQRWSSARGRIPPFYKYAVATPVDGVGDYGSGTSFP